MKNRVDNKLKFMTRCHRNLPNIRSVIDNNWNTILTNSKLENTFKEKLILAFKRNKNLKDIIGGTELRNNKKVIKAELKDGYCSPCLSQIGNICCKQIISTKCYRSTDTGEKFTIKHRVNRKTKKGIYLTACIPCTSHQYVGKFETA